MWVYLTENVLDFYKGMREGGQNTSPGNRPFHSIIRLCVLKGTSWGNLVILLKARSSRWSCLETCWISKDWDSTICLGNLFCCVTTLKIWDVFFMYSWNFPFSKLSATSWPIPVHLQEESCSIFSAPPTCPHSQLSHHGRQLGSSGMFVFTFLSFLCLEMSSSRICSITFHPGCLRLTPTTRMKWKV